MRKEESGNVYADIPEKLPAEVTAMLACGEDVRIERIVSQGQASQPGFWYDQDENEWVLLLKGEAELRFEDGDRIVRLREGDYLDIPAHTRHRVEWTDPARETIWLTVFYRGISA